MIIRMHPKTNVTHAPMILVVVALAMVSCANAFLCGDHSSTGGILAQSIRPRATFGTRCAAALQHVHVHGVTAIAKDLHPQRTSRSSIRTERPNRRVESILFARRRRGFNKGSSSADDDDEYDDEYIDNLINEKFDDVDFDDDFDDDDDDEDFIIDAEVEDRSTADDDDREYEYARVGRRRGRGAERYEEGGSADAVSSSSSSRREQRRRRRGSYGDDVDEYDGYDAEFDEEEDDYGEDYEEDYDSDDEDEDFEEGILVPNPILDSVDPEGASERIGELFEDPKFWKDMAVVALVVWTVYYLTYDPTDLIPWDSVSPNDFNLEGLYQKR